MKASETLAAPHELSSEASGGAAHKSYQQITGWQVGHCNSVSRQACQGLLLYCLTDVPLHERLNIVEHVVIERLVPLECRMCQGPRTVSLILRCV